MSAKCCLNELNRQVGALRGDLAKISSGQRVNGAGDDAAAYAISERMRKQIRSLTQDIVNVKTGRNLCQVAGGAVDSIVEELRSIKELALNSANDTNTDEDRAIIQKEYVQRCQQIDDIAHTTNYNGKILLDGRFRRGVMNVGTPDAKYTAGCPIPEVTKTNGLITDFDGVLDQFTGSEHPNLIGEPYVAAPSVSGIGYDIQLPLPDAVMPADLSNKGVTFVCEGCPEDAALIFSTDIAKGSPAIKHEDVVHSTVGYVIGVDGVTDLDDLIGTVYDSLVALKGEEQDPMTQEPCVYLLNKHNFRITKTANGEYHLRKDSPRLFLLDGFEGEFEMGYEAPLIIHHGTKANQHLRLYFENMDCKALGLGSAKLDTQAHALAMLSKFNPEKRTTSMGPIDRAISRALDMATTIGSYCQRLDTTEANLTSNHENTTDSESTIRDADMAKQMMEYTKHNVLTQSAQAMLAQANQNSSSVLSLLQ